MLIFGAYSLQAILGPAVLEVAAYGGNEETIMYAQTIVTACVISILLTAPAGAIIVSLSGTKLLTKAKPDNDEWRRGPRRSIRDITLSDEDEDDGNCETDGRDEYDRTKMTAGALEVRNERIWKPHGENLKKKKSKIRRRSSVHNFDEYHFCFNNNTHASCVFNVYYTIRLDKLNIEYSKYVLNTVFSKLFTTVF